MALRPVTLNCLAPLAGSMTETVRVRDEDYHRIQHVKERTGLSTAEALHYLLMSGAAQPGSDTAQKLSYDLSKAVQYHPRYDKDLPDEAKRELVRAMEFRTAEELYNDLNSDGPITTPSFYDPERDGLRVPGMIFNSDE